MPSYDRRRFVKTTGVAALGLTGLAGCAGSDGETTEAESSTPASTDTMSSDSDGLSKESINVLTTFYPNAGYAGVVRGKYGGYFEQAGFSEVTVDYSFELNPLSVVTSEDYDFVIGSHLDTIAGRAQGVPVQTVSTVQGNTVQAYAYDEDKWDFSGPEDFVDKTLGIQQDPDITTFNNEILSSNLSEDQRDSINQSTIGYDIRNLLTEQVDVMTKFPTNADGIILELNDEFSTGYVPMKDFIEVPGNAAITTENMIENNPDVVREFTRAHIQGLSDSLDPDMYDEVAQDCTDIVEDLGIKEEVYGDEDATAISRRALEIFKEYRPIEEWDTNGIGWNPPERVERAQQLFADAGNLDDTSPVDEIINNDFIDEVTDDQGEIIWEE